MSPQARRLAAGLLIVLFLGSAWARAQEAPVDLTTKNNVDEKLFLLRALENTYAQWPRADVEANALRQWIHGTRLRMIRLQKRMQVEKVEANIDTLYKECIQLLNDYEIFLVRIRAIQQGNFEIGGDAATIGLDAVSRGYGTWQLATSLGAAGPYALAAGGVVVVGSALYDLYQRNSREQSLNEQKKQQLDDWASVMNNRFESTYTGAETVARRLAARYQWAAEVGFDGSVKNATLADQVAKRPRDPFVVVKLADQNPFNVPAKDLARRSRDCLEAARLVPPGEEYDPFRAEFVAMAARFATDAAAKQLLRNGVDAYCHGPATLAKDAVRLNKTFLTLVPKDPNKLAHKELARAYAAANQYDQAMQTANAAVTKWDQNWGFAYRYARLQSLTGNAKAAGEWLAHSYRLQPSPNVKFVARDPDLKHFRAAAPDEYARLTTVKGRVSITYGVFNDDIVFTNQSPFALTNLKVEVTINLKKKPAINKVLTVARVGVGESHPWVNVISISRSDFESINGLHYCDQVKD